MVGLLAASSVFAAVSFGGEFKAGYNIPVNFDDFKSTTIGTYKDAEVKLSVSAKDDDGIWSVSATGELTTSVAMKGKATVNFDKLAAKLGSDWGNWKLSLTAGNNDDPAISSAYNSKVGGKYSKIKMNAPYSMVFAVKDGGWVDVQVGIDPTFNASKDISLMASAKITPIDGLAISAGYVFNGVEKVYTILDSANPEAHTGSSNRYFAHAIAAEFDLNLAKMIGLDFNLAVSGGDNFLINSTKSPATEGKVPEGKNMVNFFGVGVYAGIDLINGYAEFLMGTEIPDQGKAATSFGFITGVSSNCGISGLNVEASLESVDVADFANNYTISGGVAYGFDGTNMTLGCDVEFAPNPNKLTFTPYMVLKF